MIDNGILKIPSRLPSAAEVRAKAEAILDNFQQELKTMQASRLNGLPDGAGLSAFSGYCGVGNGYGYGSSVTGNQTTLMTANNWGPISVNRTLLSSSYVTEGLFAKVVDMPVDDAFRKGLKFKSSGGELDEDDIKKLNLAVKRQQSPRQFRKTPGANAAQFSCANLAKSDLEAVKQTCKWARLFGGGGLIVNTDQQFNKMLNPDAIREDSPLQFIAADRWELLLQTASLETGSETPYNYYGNPIHWSRVSKVMGPEAPSFYRPRLQGWGMSVLERCIRPVNAFIKFEKLLFELLDEAKIDVYKIKGFNTAMASARSTSLMAQRIRESNQIKNFESAIAMDIDDDYAQKQLSFTGIPEIWEQLRLNLCAYLDIPYNKLFGQSAGGFSSGKDSLDNYNSTCEMMREWAEPLCLAVGELRCQQLFGFIPEDLEVDWEALDVLNGVEQEAVKTSQQNRVIQKFTSGLEDGKEAMEELDKMDLQLVETAVGKGLREPEPPLSQNQTEVEGQQKHDKDMLRAAPKPGAKK